MRGLAYWGVEHIGYICFDGMMHKSGDTRLLRAVNVSNTTCDYGGPITASQLCAPYAAAIVEEPRDVWSNLRRQN